MGEKRECNYLKVDDEGVVRELAYVKDEGHATPGIVFIPGFMSDKDAQKPIAIRDFCVKHGLPFLRYDSTAQGESRGNIERKDARLSHWIKDAEEVLLRLTEGPQLLIGSSMGAWVASILAKKYPERVHSLLFLAPSINFSNFYIEKLRKSATPLLLQVLESGGSYDYPDSKFGSYPLSLRVFEDMIPFELPLDTPDAYPVTCPVRVLHGTKDVFSPYETALKVLEGFQTDDLQLIYIKNADHHFDEFPALEVVFDQILKLCGKSKVEEEVEEVEEEEKKE